MAEATIIEDQRLEELEREITCGICQEHYSEPKILPCLHYYCKQCLLQLALRTAPGEPFSCPECRHEATLPEGGVDELKTAFFINRIQTTVSAIKQPNSIVTNSIDPSKCSIQLDKTATVGKLMKGILKAKSNSHIICQLKCLHNGVSKNCLVREKQSGSYSIQCTPAARGRHELIILIDGRHLNSSPFPVYVSIHPKQLGKPVKVWKNISKPITIAATSKGNVLVTEKEGNVIKISLSGEREAILSLNKTKALRLIAVDNEDIIYCSYENSNKILMCDENGKNAKMYEIKHCGGPGIFNINNEHFVSEASKPGTFIVYDRDLNFKRCVSHKNVGLILDMSADIHGNIYATDYSHSCIHVVNSNGDYLCCFATDNSNVQSPWGVCVSGQYVYRHQW